MDAQALYFQTSELETCAPGARYMITLSVIVAVLKPGWDKSAVRVQSAFLCNYKHFQNTPTMLQSLLFYTDHSDSYNWLIALYYLL